MKPLWILLLCALLGACATEREDRSASPPETPRVLEESLKNIGVASPESLAKAESALEQSTAGYSERGLELSYVAYKMIELIYPLYLRPEYAIDPTSNSIYPAIFNDIERGKFPRIGQRDVSFLTLILPPVAALRTTDRSVEDLAEESLDDAERLNPESALPPYLKGVIAERRGERETALDDYRRALSVGPSCYPAEVGEARIFLAEGRDEDARALLDALSGALPPDAEIERLDAESLFELGSLQAADRAIAASVRDAPRDAEARLLAAEIYEREGKVSEGVAQISAAEALGLESPELFLLEARLFDEMSDPLKALGALARAVKRFPSDPEIAKEYTKALLEVGRTAEGSSLLAASLRGDPESASSLRLLVDSAVSGSNWKRAARYVASLVAVDDSDRSLAQASLIYARLGDPKTAALYARRLEARHPDDPGYVIPYVEALLAAGEREEAARAIGDGLSALTLPSARSTLYYLKSTLEPGRTARLADLKAALLENLADVEALRSLAELYRASGERATAIWYLREASAVDPGDRALAAELETLETAR